MEKTPWFPPNTHPTRRGLYERDWTHTDILPVEDRRISMDLWEPVFSKRDSLYPGVWYVEPGWNDASRQHLPWRGLVRPNVQIEAPDAALSRQVASNAGLVVAVSSAPTFEQGEKT